MGRSNLSGVLESSCGKEGGSGTDGSGEGFAVNAVGEMVDLSREAGIDTEETEDNSFVVRKGFNFKCSE